jgi:hypothetical protein
MPQTVRILVANEPRSYRETIAAALKTMCPDLAVEVACSCTLDREVGAFRPDVVVCSRASEAVREGVFAWVELYPDYSSSATVSVGGELSTVEGAGFGDLLRVVEAAMKASPDGTARPAPAPDPDQR